MTPGRLKKRYVYISLLLSCYILAYILWPFYIDVKLMPGVGLNPQRFLSVVFAAIAILIFSVKPEIFYSIYFGYRKRPIFFISLFAYFIWRTISAVAAGAVASYALVLYEVLTYLLMFIGFWVFVLAGNNDKQFFSIIKWATITIFIIGLDEYIRGSNIFAGFATNSTRLAITASAIIREGGIRVKTTFEHPLTLVQYLAITLPLLLISGKAYYGKLTRLILLMFGASLLVMTKSRSALIFVAIVTGYYYLMLYLSGTRNERKSRYLIFLFLFIAFLAVSSLVLNVEDELFGRSLFDSSARVAQLLNGVVAIMASPLWGYGPGIEAGELIYNIASGSGSAAEMWESNATTVDNRYLSIAIESGLPAVVLFIVFSLNAIYKTHGLLIRAGRIGIKDKYWYSLLGASLSCIGALTTMFILSIFTVHSLFFISLSLLVYSSIKLENEINSKR